MIQAYRQRGIIMGERKLRQRLEELKSQGLADSCRVNLLTPQGGTYQVSVWWDIPVGDNVG